MVKTTLVTARTTHHCNDCRSRIPGGTRYLASKMSPNHDGIGNVGWVRYKECQSCASRYGRGHLFHTDTKESNR